MVGKRLFALLIVTCTLGLAVSYFNFEGFVFHISILGDL